eukprot:gene5542-6901_t
MSAPFLQDVSKSHTLKPTETHDSSAPKIDPSVQVKKNDRGAFLDDVAKGTNLKHAETHDTSAPKIDSDAHIKQNERGALLGEIKAKGTN